MIITRLDVEPNCFVSLGLKIFSIETVAMSLQQSDLKTELKISKLFGMCIDFI